MYDKVKFSDIAGYENQKNEAMKIATFLKHYDEFVVKGAFLPKGAIFFGPPGTGKTLFGNAIANEAGVKTYSISNEEFYKSSNTSEKIKQVFNDAKKNAPCIIFIDEIDTIVPTRQNSSDVLFENLRVLLTSIDDIQKTGVMVIATANSNLSSLPQALIRNGRLEKHIAIQRPDLEDRIKLIDYYCKKSKGFENINPATVASYSADFTCSSIESLINEVLINSIMNNNSKITFRDFIEPINNIRNQGIKSKKVNDNDHVIIHEIGHFIVDYVLRNKVGMLCSIPYGNTSGSYYEVDEECDRTDLLTFDDYRNEISVNLAGLAATEVYFGKKYNGASQDIKNVQALFNGAIRNGLLGFKELSLLGTALNQTQDIRGNSIVFDNSNLLVKSRECLFNELYENDKKIILENKELCDIVFKKLKKSDILLKDELESIIRKYQKSKSSDNSDTNKE